MPWIVLLWFCGSMFCVELPFGELFTVNVWWTVINTMVYSEVQKMEKNSEFIKRIITNLCRKKFKVPDFEFSFICGNFVENENLQNSQFVKMWFTHWSKVKFSNFPCFAQQVSSGIISLQLSSLLPLGIQNISLMEWQMVT
jgi:hypothetical protein